MDFLKPFLNCVIAFFALTFPFAQATAAPNALFIAVPPIQVTNHLKTDADRQIVRPYLQVNSKKEGETVCRWMPRVRDAFFTALNSLAYTTPGRLENSNLINTALTQAAYRAVPKNLVAGVIAFNVHNTKDYRAERKLKGIMRCPNKTKKKSKKKTVNEKNNLYQQNKISARRDSYLDYSLSRLGRFIDYRLVFNW